MENPFADPSVVEAQRAAANAPIEEDNPFAEDVGEFHFSRKKERYSKTSKVISIWLLKFF